VYFDLCLRLYRKDKNSKELEPYLLRVWQRAQRTGLLAYFLAERVPGSSPRSALAAGMLAHAGKLHLATWLQERDYASFEMGLDGNAELPPLARQILERDKFGVTQETVGAHTLRYFDTFKSLIPAVQNFREPYCLKGVDSAGHGLAVILWLADAMARSWKTPTDEKDPVFTEWSYPALLQLKIRRSMLIEVMKKAMTLK
jgi:HD-like signal output (HDOD) protein